jgi:hypothetical protein
VNGGIELPLELGPREPQRFERPQPFGIANGPRVFLGTLVLQIFHPLLNPRLSVDQSFARVSHSMISSLASCRARGTRWLSRRPKRQIPPARLEAAARSPSSAQSTL